MTVPVGDHSERSASLRAARRAILVATLGLAIAACGPTGAGSSSSVSSTTTSAPVSSASSAARPRPRRTSDLDTYVIAETAIEAAAAQGSSQAVWPPAVSQRSAIVQVNGTPVSVVAYGFDATGHPVQVLAEENGAWTVVASLPPPVEPGTVSHPDSLYLYASRADGVDNLTGHLNGGSPAFFVPFTSGGCTRGPVVSDVGGTWHYLSFTGDGSTGGEVVGGNPRFVDTTLVTDNDCAASRPSREITWTWVYNPRSGGLVATATPGWPRQPGWTY